MIFIHHMHPLFKGNIFYYLPFEMYFEGKRTIEQLIHCLMWKNLETKYYSHVYRKLRAVCFILFLSYDWIFPIVLYPFHEFMVYRAWGWYMYILYDYLCNAQLHKGDRNFMHIHVYFYKVLSKRSLTSEIKLILSMLCLQLYKILNNQMIQNLWKT